MELNRRKPLASGPHKRCWVFKNERQVLVLTICSGVYQWGGGGDCQQREVNVRIFLNKKISRKSSERRPKGSRGEKERTVARDAKGGTHKRKNLVQAPERTSRTVWRSQRLAKPHKKFS